MINARSPYHIEYTNVVTTTTLATTTTTSAPIATTTTTQRVYENYTINNFSTTETLFFEYRSGPSTMTADSVAASSTKQVCMYTPEFNFQRTGGSTSYTSGQSLQACSP
tara:strand:+ start:51 stop:377 length:327 start_codon:yes stop_codon:yes gene_type:complete